MFQDSRFQFSLWFSEGPGVSLKLISLLWEEEETYTGVK